MIKFTAAMPEGGTLYGFGLTEANLNRLEFNSELIFFDFGYAGRPDLFGFIVYLSNFDTPEDILSSINEVKFRYLSIFDVKRGITLDTVFFFPFARSIIAKFRDTPFWSFNSEVAITHADDKQVFFAGRTEEEIELYLQKSGLIQHQTKRTPKGFG